MDKYKMLLSEISNRIKPLGLKKAGDSFFYNQDGNIGLINFQKSKDSASETIIFTINLGTYSSSLSMFDRPDIKSKVLISDCHWRERIGLLLPQKKDHWWQITESTSLPNLVKEIAEILSDVAIPEIKNWISDRNLEKFWMNGISSGLSEQQMYIYLIALLKTSGRSDLNKKVGELKMIAKGKPFQRNVNENLLKLGIDV